MRYTAQMVMLALACTLAGCDSSNGPEEEDPIATRDPNASAVVTDADGNVFAVNQLLVLLEEGAGMGVARKIASAVGAQVVGQIPCLGIYQLELTSTTIPELNTASVEARRHAQVEAVSYNLFGELAGCATPSDNNKNLSAYADRAPWQDIQYYQALTVFEALRPALLLHPVQVAVIDSGVDGQFGELASMGFAGQLINVLDPTTDPVDHAAPTSWSKRYHGTQVASAIAAEDNGIGMNGVASRFLGQKLSLLVGAAVHPDAAGKWDASVVASRALATAARAVKEQGADVVNMSFGFTVPQTSKAEVKEIQKQFARLFEKLEEQALFVTSAGNEGLKLDGKNKVPGGMQHPNLVTVAASAEGAPAQVAEFSNYGVDQVDVVAPGDKIPLSNPASALVRTSGTSFAAPLVSSLAAIIASLDPGLAPSRIRDIILAWPLGRSMDSAMDKEGGLYTRLNLYHTLGQHLLASHGDVVKVTELLNDPERDEDPWLAGQALTRMCGVLRFGAGQHGPYELTGDDLLAGDLSHITIGGAVVISFADDDGLFFEINTSDELALGVPLLVKNAVVKTGGECDPWGNGAGGQLTLDACWIEQKGPLRGKMPAHLTLVGSFSAPIELKNDPCGDLLDVSNVQLSGTFDLMAVNNPLVQTQAANQLLLDVCTQGRRE